MLKYVLGFLLIAGVTVFIWVLAIYFAVMLVDEIKANREFRKALSEAEDQREKMNDESTI